MEMASPALRTATFMPRTWVFMRSAMARPAASSLALLMRRPDDRRCMVVLRLALLAAVLRWALREATLVLMVMAMGKAPWRKV